MAAAQGSRRTRITARTGLSAVVVAAAMASPHVIVRASDITISNTLASDIEHSTNYQLTGTGTVTFDTNPGNIHYTGVITDFGTHSLAKTGPGTLSFELYPRTFKGAASIRQGTVAVAGGSSVASTDTYIGLTPGLNPSMHIWGPGATWYSYNKFKVGYQGEGTLSLGAGGTLNTVTSAIGHDLGVWGSASVVDAGSKWTTSFLDVGVYGIGILEVRGGGEVSVAKQAVLGGSAGSAGTMRASDAGSVLSMKDVVVGAAGTGHLSATDGGRIISSGIAQVSSTGTLLLNNGTLQAASLQVDAGGTFEVGAGGGILDISGTTSRIAGSTVGTGALRKTGSGTLTMAGPSGPAGGVVLESGTLALGGSQGLSGSTISFAGGTLGYAPGISTDVSGQIAPVPPGAAASVDTGGNTVAFASPITGAGGVTKRGEGTLILQATNTYAGTTQALGGNLIAATPSALPQFNVAGRVQVDAATISASVGAGGWTSADVYFLNSSATFTNDAKLGFDVANGQTFVHSLPIIGAAGVAKSGVGTLTLAGNNTYAGSARVDAGTLVIGSPNALGASRSVSFTGGAMDVAGQTVMLAALNGSAGTVKNDSSNAAVLHFAGAGTPSTFGGVIADGAGQLELQVSAGRLTLSGVNTFSGGTQVTGGTLVVNTPASLPRSEVTVAEGGTIQIPVSAAGPWAEANVDTLLASATLQPGAKFAADAVGSATWSSSKYFAAGLVKRGPGELTLAATNTFRGPLSIEAGSVTATAGALDAYNSSHGIRIDNSRLRLTTQLTTAKPFELDGTAVLAGSGFTPMSLSGPITGSGSLTVELDECGLTLSGDNSYSGGTRLKSGGLTVTSVTSLGTGGLEFAGGSFTYETDSPSGTINVPVTVSGNSQALISVPRNELVLAQGISGTGRLTKSFDGTLTLLGDSTLTANTIVHMGTLNVPTGATLSSYDLTIATGKGFVADMQVSGEVGLTSEAMVGAWGSAGLTVSDGGKLTNENGFVAFESGSTGAATVTGAGSVWTSRKGLYVGGTAAGGRGTGSLTVADGGVIEVGETLRVWAGRGSLTLDGGTIRAKNLVSESGNTVLLSDRGGVLQLSEGSSIAGAVTGAGSLTKSGAGRLELQSINTYSGNTYVSEGTLALSGDYQNSLAASPHIAIATGATLDVTGLRDGTFVMSDAQGVEVNGTFVGTLLGTGTIGGSGTVGSLAIAAGGAIAPGNSVGTLNVAGDLSLLGTYYVEIDPSAGAADLLRVSGSADITGSTLSVSLLSAPAPGQTFTVLQMSGSEPLVGTFLSLEQGAMVLAMWNGTEYPLEVSYAANTDGGSLANDVTLTAVPEPGTLTMAAASLCVLLRRRRCARATTAQRR